MRRWKERLAVAALSVVGAVAFTALAVWATTPSDSGVNATTSGTEGVVTADQLVARDANTANANYFQILGNNAVSTGPTCANKGTSGRFSLLDTDNTSALQGDLCTGTSLLWRYPATTTTATDVLFGTSTAGVPVWGAIDLGTDTTGNYVATVAGTSNSSIAVTGSGSETAAVTLTQASRGATAYHNATISVASGGFGTALDHNTDLEDTDAFHPTSATGFCTANNTSIYGTGGASVCCTGSNTWDAANPCSRYMFIPTNFGGRYAISCSIGFADTSSTGIRMYILAIYDAGTAKYLASPSTPSNAVLNYGNPSTTYKFAAGDAVYCVAYQTTTANQNVAAAGNDTTLRNNFISIAFLGQ